MSLRRQLISRIVAVMVVGGVVAAAIGGLTVHDEILELLDRQLIQVSQIALQAQLPEQRVPPGRTMRLRDGQVVVQRWTRGTRVDLSDPTADLPQPQRPGLDNIEADGRGWRQYALRTTDGWVVAAQRNDSRFELVAATILTPLLPVMICVPFIWWLVASVVERTLAPVDRLVRDLEQRAPLSASPLEIAGTPTEMLPLVTAFNRMLERVSSGIAREREFVIDAAHALRTPVTALQLQGECLLGAKDRPDYDERVHDLQAGIARARRTVEQLLALASTEREVSGCANIRESFASLSETFESVARAKHVVLKFRDEGFDAVDVRLHPAMLATALGNLIDNAVRYSPIGGTVAVNVELSQGRFVFSVKDEGPGVRDAELETVFDRFRRAEHDVTTGTGLGLAIVRAIAQGAGGRAWLAQSDRGGLCAYLELPAVEVKRERHSMDTDAALAGATVRVR